MKLINAEKYILEIHKKLINILIILMNIIKKNIYKSIIASKVDIDVNDIENTNNIIKKILSEKNFDISVYHMESFYRDSSNDYKYFKDYSIAVTSKFK